MSSAVFSFDPSERISTMGNLFKSARVRDQELGRSELYVTKLDKVIQGLTPCTLEEIGATSWVKKLNSIIMVKNGLEDNPQTCMKLLFQHKKATVFVQDLITVNHWIREIMPQLIEAIKANAKAKAGPSPPADGKDDDSICGSTTLMVLHHARHCSGFVTILMRDPTFVIAPESSDMIMGIIDHSINELQNFMAKKPDHDPKLDTGEWKSKTELSYEEEYQSAKLNIECLFRLALKLLELPNIMVTKFLHPSTRLLITMVDLILTKPWCYIIVGSPGYEFISFTPPQNSRPIRVPFDPIETMSWQILKEVLVPKPAQSARLGLVFPMDNECTDKLLLLQEPLKVKSFVENMPGSYDLKIYLAQAKFVPLPADAPEPHNGTLKIHRHNPSLGSPIFSMTLEIELQPPPSPFHEAIRADLLEKKEAILQIHEAMETFKTRPGEQGQNRFDRTLDALWMDMNHHCFKCGNTDAKSRCSRCHFAWYCDRKCQSKDWTKHKPQCKQGIMAELSYSVEYDKEEGAGDTKAQDCEDDIDYLA